MPNSAKSELAVSEGDRWRKGQDRRGKGEGRGACPHRVSAEAEAGSEVQISTLPADQQEPARKEWVKVLRPFKRREPWL